VANYYGQGRTNTFAVRDVDALKSALADYEIEVIDRDDSQVTLLANNEDGDFSVWTFDDDEDTEDSVFIPDMIAEFMQPGQIAVFVHSGWEKMRYMSAWGLAVHSDGRQIRISVDDIYAIAAKVFDVDPQLISVAAY
jgi:hypothetical protein